MKQDEILLISHTEQLFILSYVARLNNLQISNIPNTVYTKITLQYVIGNDLPCLSLLFHPLSLTTIKNNKDKQKLSDKEMKQLIRDIVEFELLENGYNLSQKDLKRVIQFLN